MAIEEKIKELLASNGLSSRQCDEVLQLLKDDEANAPMKDRWTDNVDDYLPSVIDVLWIGAKDKALEYIDENCPQAWFRPMFTDDPAPQLDGDQAPPST